MPIPPTFTATTMATLPTTAAMVTVVTLAHTGEVITTGVTVTGRGRPVPSPRLRPTPLQTLLTGMATTAGAAHTTTPTATTPTWATTGPTPTPPTATTPTATTPTTGSGRGALMPSLRLPLMPTLRHTGTETLTVFMATDGDTLDTPGPTETGATGVMVATGGDFTLVNP